MSDLVSRLSKSSKIWSEEAEGAKERKLALRRENSKYKLTGQGRHEPKDAPDTKENVGPRKLTLVVSAGRPAQTSQGQRRVSESKHRALELTDCTSRDLLRRRRQTSE
jgi:hypothetical protein